MLINFNIPGQPQWRTFEREAAAEVFGGVRDVDLGFSDYHPHDVIRWFPPSEEIGVALYNRLQECRRYLPNYVAHINDQSQYLFMHDKLRAFAAWRAVGLPVPDWFEFADEFHPQFDPPYLLRLNNSVAGQHSILIREAKEVPAALAHLWSWWGSARVNGRGIETRPFCVQYHDTRRGELNVSYRIIIAGGKIVTGYARVSDPADWVAVTNKFHGGIASAWFETNRRCHEFMAAHESELVQAVRELKLNHQGLDVIEEPATGRWYLLETQTTYDAGFKDAGPYVPPFYNPYNPDLVKFIQDNRAEIARELPLYHDAWLDKREHFRRCYQNLKEAL